MRKPEKFESTLLSKKYITDTILEIKLSAPSGLEFKPGQFVNVAVTHPYRRPHSVVRYKNNEITLFVEVRHEGKGSNFFRNAKKGDTTEIMAFLGRYTLQDTNRNKIFISTGTGVAPFISMIESLKESSLYSAQSIYLLHGMRSLKNDIPGNYLNTLIEKEQISYIRCVSKQIDLPNGSYNNRYEYGRVTDIIPKINFDMLHSDFYICGGHHVIESTTQVLKNLGAKYIFTEDWG